MKFQLEAPGTHNVFTGYGAGYVEVNTVRYSRHVVVAASGVTDWNIRDFDALSGTHVADLRALKPEILLLGTGDRLRFPASALSRLVVEAGIGLEIMDTPAACRTYNIIAAEGRIVVAAVLVP